MAVLAYFLLWNTTRSPVFLAESFGFLRYEFRELARDREHLEESDLEIEEREARDEASDCLTAASYSSNFMAFFNF